MSFPIACASSDTYDTTCYNPSSSDGSGSDVTFQCPEGTACAVPYLPGLPASPGMFIPPGVDRGQLHTCEEGDWCPLGMSNVSELACPPAYFCSEPSVLVGPSHAAVWSLSLTCAPIHMLMWCGCGVSCHHIMS